MFIKLIGTTKSVRRGVLSTLPPLAHIYNRGRYLVSGPANVRGVSGDQWLGADTSARGVSRSPADIRSSCYNGSQTRQCDMSADTGPRNTSFWGHLKLYIYHFMNTPDSDRISTEFNQIQYIRFHCKNEWAIQETGHSNLKPLKSNSDRLSTDFSWCDPQWTFKCT